MDVVSSRTGSPDLPLWLDRWGAAWAAAVHEGESAGLDGATPWQPEEVLALVRHGGHDQQQVLVAAVEDGRVLGGALASLPLLDNRDLVEVSLAVRPADRGRGAGTAVLREVARLVAAEGRASLITEVSRPLAADGGVPDDLGWVGSRFAARAGLRRGLVDVRRDLPLPVDPGHLDALAAEAGGASRGYAVRTWVGPTPPQDRGRLAALTARMSTDAPMGDLQVEPEVWDAGRVAATEERWAAQDRTWVTAVATAPDGAWVGYTMLGRSAWTPQRLHQWDTLVLREHRGHRLGLALKVAALRAATARWPEARVVGTWNAASNAPMIAVNEALGFRPAEALEEWQGGVEGALALSGAAPGARPAPVPQPLR